MILLLQRNPMWKTLAAINHGDGWWHPSRVGLGMVDEWFWVGPRRLGPFHRYCGFSRHGRHVRGLRRSIVGRGLTAGGPRDAVIFTRSLTPQNDINMQKLQRKQCEFLPGHGSQAQTHCLIEIGWLFNKTVLWNMAQPFFCSGGLGGSQSWKSTKATSNNAMSQDVDAEALVTSGGQQRCWFQVSWAA